jgi:hypothetical protein
VGGYEDGGYEDGGYEDGGYEDGGYEDGGLLVSRSPGSVSASVSSPLSTSMAPEPVLQKLCVKLMLKL